jgi:hypothetical protein
MWTWPGKFSGKRSMCPEIRPWRRPRVRIRSRSIEFQPWMALAGICVPPSAAPDVFGFVYGLRPNFFYTGLRSMEENSEVLSDGPVIAKYASKDHELKEMFVFLLTLIGIHLIYSSY